MSQREIETERTPVKVVLCLYIFFFIAALLKSKFLYLLYVTLFLIDHDLTDSISCGYWN